MSPSHGSNADIIGNGYTLSRFLNSASFSASRDASETTVFKSKSKTYIPGLKDTTMTAEGIYDGDIDAVDEILNAALNSSASGVFSYMPDGEENFGTNAFTINAIETSYEVTTDVGDVAQISAEFGAGDKGRFAQGRVIHSMKAEAAAGNGQPLDGGAATSNGGALVVHATAAANLAVTLQDSADGVTFADIGSLNFPVGRGSQRLLIEGAIRRYTRVLWTGSGTFLAVVERH